MPTSISIIKQKKFSEFLEYLYIVIKNKEFGWLLWIIIMKIFGRNKCKWYFVRETSKIIGGFVIADFPVAKWKPYNFLNEKARSIIKHLRQKGYLGFCCFIIDSKFRNSGIGSLVWETFFSEYPVKLYFTASRKAVPFYLRHGCKAFYPDRYTIYTYENNVIK